VSTFSGISTALSSLIAQRTALEVSGHNVANANTEGYTRQRAQLGAVATVQVASMFSHSDGVGGGVRVAGIGRADDVFLDAKLRAQTSGASYLAARADVYGTLETSLGEPSETALAAQLSTFWAGWHDVANNPEVGSTRAVLLDDARQLTDSLHRAYGSIAAQWREARDTAVSLVDRVNAVAANIADLNGRIQSVTLAGGVAHELADQRDQLVTELSGLVGASVQRREDGQVDVFVGGNALAFGSTTHRLAVAGAVGFDQATGAGGDPALGVTLTWADRPGRTVALDGGRVAGLLTALAAPDATGNGTGGILTEAAARLDAVATSLATAVNALHTTARTVAGATGTDFFTLPTTGSTAAGIAVALAGADDVAVAGAGLGAYDSSVGQQLAAIGLRNDGPDDAWSRTVVEIGNRAAAATSRGTVAEAARASAESQRLANASVDTDEEAVSMLASQRAYEAAARVLTAIDEMLDTLINKTGVVGR